MDAALHRHCFPSERLHRSSSGTADIPADGPGHRARRIAAAAGDLGFGESGGGGRGAKRVVVVVLVFKWWWLGSSRRGPVIWGREQGALPCRAHLGWAALQVSIHLSPLQMPLSGFLSPVAVQLPRRVCCCARLFLSNSTSYSVVACLSAALLLQCRTKDREVRERRRQPSRWATRRSLELRLCPWSVQDGEGFAGRRLQLGTGVRGFEC
jgi:hypothetical protein